MTKKTRNGLLAIFILAFPFALFSFFFFSRMADIPPAPPPLPNPNGYDDFVKAGKMLARDTGIFNETDLTQVREIVSVNAAALVLAREGLGNQCRVPVKYTAAFSSNHGGEMGSIKFLARAFIAEGRLAEMENRPADAAKSYLDTIHLANESARGGMVIDKLVGEAIEEYGVDHLQRLLPKLDAKTCRKTAAALEALDAQTPTWNEAMQQASEWSHRTFFGWRQELASLLDNYKLRMNQKYEKVESDLKEKHLASRRLIFDLAARAYKLDSGKPPASAADLVPDYLKAVPQDPVTGRNLGLQ
jgi:hypothetical protein